MNIRAIVTYFVAFAAFTIAYSTFAWVFQWQAMMSVSVAIPVIAVLIAVTPRVELFTNKVLLIRFVILASALSTAFLYGFPLMANGTEQPPKFALLTVDDLFYTFFFHSAVIGITAWWYPMQVIHERQNKSESSSQDDEKT